MQQPATDYVDLGLKIVSAAFAILSFCIGIAIRAMQAERKLEEEQHRNELKASLADDRSQLEIHKAEDKGEFTAIRDSLKRIEAWRRG